MGWDCYLVVANMICFSMFDIVNLLLKKNASVEKNALEYSGCRRVFDGGLGRKFYLGPGEISSVVCTLLNSRMGDAG